MALDESKVALQSIITRPGETMQYTYDFGDDWFHEILLEGVFLPEPRVVYPRCIAGERSGPPEDVGGPDGYDRYLEALADPNHEDHEHWLDWGGPFDPKEFDIAAINEALRKFAKPAATPAARKRASAPQP